MKQEGWTVQELCEVMGINKSDVHKSLSLGFIPCLDKIPVGYNPLKQSLPYSAQSRDIVTGSVISWLDATRYLLPLRIMPEGYNNRALDHRAINYRECEQRKSVAPSVLFPGSAALRVARDIGTRIAAASPKPRFL
jgi:hypothetical protein